MNCSTVGYDPSHSTAVVSSYALGRKSSLAESNQFQINFIQPQPPQTTKLVKSLLAGSASKLGNAAMAHTHGIGIPALSVANQQTRDALQGFNILSQGIAAGATRLSVLPHSVSEAFRSLTAQLLFLTWFVDFRDAFQRRGR